MPIEMGKESKENNNMPISRDMTSYSHLQANSGTPEFFAGKMIQSEF